MNIKEKNLYELWTMLISRKSAGTALSYEGAMKRFIKDNGNNVVFEDITPEFIDKWREKMRGELSKTTVNIYLRSFSALAHLAYECRLITITPKFLFRGLSIFSRHSSNSRRHYYLPPEEWKKMWRFYESSGEDCEEFQRCRACYRKAYLEGLGIMLFMYLGNGMNLRDMCGLRYDKFYFQQGGKMIRFCRHKTAERTGLEVEIPILREMQMIIERQGQKPEQGKLIFPYMMYDVGDDLREHKCVADLGHCVRDRMKAIARFLNFPHPPTPTWARHSFATNLIQSGVPKDYVMWAMTHSDNNVTSIYIATYGYEKMVEYNTLLLHAKGSEEHLLAQINSLPKEKVEKIIRKLQEGNI